MIWRCLDSLTVLAAFVAVYILPPLLALRRLQSFPNRATLLVVSAGLGLSSQALLGFFWNHSGLGWPIAEGIVYFSFWLAVGIAMQLRPERTPSTPTPQAPLFAQPPFLAILLVAAFTLRSFDALNHASLGQSDAYTHLQFLRDVVSCGHIRNIVYPPGYSWVLALPVMTFNLDAYLVARYVGPFFGTLMIVALYLLGCRYSQVAGLFAAFLAGVCPLFYPLIKTGMGAFANQLGLLLFPLALLLYLVEARILFIFILLGLTISVPLFVFNLALIIFAHKLLCFPSSPRSPQNTAKRWWLTSLLLLLAFLLAFGLASYHFLKPGKLHLTTTATLVTGIETPAPKKQSISTRPPTIIEKIETHPAGKLVVDLLTVKRWGMGNTLMNLATLTLAGIFSSILVVGFRRSADLLKLIGIWGLITTLEASTGFLEWSRYQRSGWLLMQATALAGGLIAAWFYGLEKMRGLIRTLIVLGLSISLILVLWMPPQHRCITSGAEDELATVLRELSNARLDALHARGRLSFERQKASPLIAQAASAPRLALFARRYTLFNADQGNIADVLPDPLARIRQIPVEVSTRLVPPCAHFLCIIDRSTGLPEMGLLDRISPELTQSLTAYQPLLYKPNEFILAFIKALPTNTWHITQENRGTNLSIYLVERQVLNAPCSPLTTL